MKEIELDDELKKKMIHSVLSDYKSDLISKRDLNNYLARIKGLFDNDDMAIIGLSCELPDAKDHVQFWENLMGEKESIKNFPDKRTEDYEKVLDFNEKARKGGYLDEIDQFDAEYFKIPPKLAEQMDPYHRKILQTLTNCIEDAGYYKEQLFNTKTGIFIGHDQTHKLATSYFDFLEEIGFTGMIGSWTGMLASRISYLFNFKGPAIVLDSGCSSAMVAIDSAIKSIKSGDCDTALVGGINLFFLPNDLDKSAQSDDFCVRTFDTKANGTIWSEGVACIYIKPLSKAILDKDHIYGVIKGMALNNDGKTSSWTAPSSTAQKEVILHAWKKAGIVAEDISYIESHGTGTILGDPLEIKALTEAFKTQTDKKQFCGIGSVKSNIGHTVGLSGLVSFIKVLMSFKRGYIPPTINFSEPNQLIDFVNSPLYVQKDKMKWNNGIKETVMGVSSFSFTGTNIHLVAKSYFSEHRKNEFHQLIFPISAKNDELMIKTAERLQRFLNAGDYLIEDVSYTMCCCRKHQDFRAVIVTDNIEHLSQALEDLIIMLYKKECNSQKAFEKAYRIYFDNCLDDVVKSDHKELESLALEYINGSEVDFLSLFNELDVFKCSLPPTEFDNKRFWEKATKKRLETFKPNISNGKEMKTPTNVNELLQEAWSEVLGYEQIKFDDNFFQLGGDSISGFKVTSYLSEILKIDIPSMGVLNYPVFSDFLGYIQNLIPVNDGFNEKVEMNNEIQDPDECLTLPLSSAQRGMYLSSHIMTDSLDYNIIAMMVNDKSYSFECINDAINNLIERHDALRASFFLQDDNPVQIINHEVKADVNVFHIDSDESLIEQTLKEKVKEVSKSFNLKQASLFRVYNIIINSVHNFIIFDIHHIIADGTSMGILIHEFWLLMDTLPEKRYNYPLITRKIYQKEEKASSEDHLKWWVDKFKDGAPVLNLVTDRPRPPVRSYKGFRVRKKIDKSFLDRVKTFALKSECTLYMVLFGGLYQLICRLTNETDHVIGTLAANRTSPEEWEAVGMFINTLPLRINLDQDMTVLDSFHQLKHLIIEYFAHQEINYEMLLEEMNIQRSSSRNPLFDIYFSLQNVDMGIDQNYELIEPDIVSTKFDIMVVAREEKDGLVIDWDCSSDLFDINTIDNLASKYLTFLERIIDDFDSKICHIEFVTEEEKADLFKHYKRPVETYDSIVSVFENNVYKFGKIPAVLWDEYQLTYCELNKRANAIAKALIDSGFHGNLPVALLFERSVDMIITIFGVLKSGGYYIPIDNNAPTTRKQTILADSESKIILSHKELWKDLQTDDLIVIDIESIDFDHETNLDTVRSGEDIAYMIYTSGTTGTPKGTLISDKSVLRLAKGIEHFSCGENDRFLQGSNYSFDASVFEIFTPLLNGAGLVLIDQTSLLNSEKLRSIIKDKQVTLLFLTTALFNAHVDSNVELLGDVDKVLFGGEMASSYHVKKAYDFLGPNRMINCYGPTEICVIATTYLVDKMESSSYVPIGKPILDTSTYVLSNHLKLQPKGFLGELYIGGSGVAKGYYKRDELTRKSFIVNPYDVNEIIYKTGDQVVITHDGNIRYLSRADKQIKLRGYRIETEEIVNIALESKMILECYCDAIIKDSTASNLLLWVVPLDNYEKNKFIQYFQQNLPEYMVPSIIVEIDRLPVNSSGKVDVTMLKIPDDALDRAIVVAENDTQQDLVEAWKQVFGLEEISIKDNFFAIGGDSIKALQIASRLYKLNYDVTVAQILEFKTIEIISENIKKVVVTIEEQGDVTGNLIPSAIQQVYLNKKDYSSRFNQGIHLKLDKNISFLQFKTAMERLIIYHDTLRTILDKKGNLFIRDNSNMDALLYCQEVNVDDENILEFYNELQNKIDPLKGPMIAAGYYQSNSIRNLILVAHHLVVDVVSWAILTEDLVNLMIEPHSDLPAKTMSYKMWNEYYYNQAKSGVYRKNIDHWVSMSDCYKKQINIFDINDNPIKRGWVEFYLSEEITPSVLSKANNAFHTKTSDLIILSLCSAIAKWMKVNSILVNLEGHGRPEEAVNLIRTIGWFTSMYPVLLEYNSDIAEYIKNAKELLVSSSKKGLEFLGLKLFDDGLIKADKKSLDLLKPNISINYLGMHNDEMVDGIVASRIPQELCVDKSFQNDYLLDCIITLVKNRVKIEIEYQIPENDLFNEKTLVETIQEEIRQIINYCYTSEKEEKTVSDYSVSGMTALDLKDILDDVL